MRKIFPFLIVFWLSVHTAYSEEIKVDYIPSSQYFETTLNEINNAKSSIQVFMYLISIFPNQTDSQAQKFAQALVDAKNRGANVKVILDRTPDFQEEAAGMSGKNQNAYEFLKERGVPVFFDEPGNITHAKTIVIDNETVILGSTNWSKAALTQNHEASNIVRSKKFAQKVLNDMAHIKIQETPAVITPVVRIPKTFLTNKLVNEGTGRPAERTFDVYLCLLKEHSGDADPKIVLDYDKIAECLGITQMNTEGRRREISKALRYLKGCYGLIDYKTAERIRPFEIILKEPAGDFFELPEAYWKYGWNRYLSFPSKVMSLILRSYTSSSSPSFFMSLDTFSKKYSVSKKFIIDGTKELKRLNLLSIRYGEIKNGAFSDRDANVYSPKPFYDPEDLRKELRRLEENYGKEKFQRAVETAKALFEENNSKSIRVLIELENKYGATLIQEALKPIVEKHRDNPKRSMGYLINTVKNMAKQIHLEPR